MEPVFDEEVESVASACMEMLGLDPEPVHGRDVAPTASGPQYAAFKEAFMTCLSCTLASKLARFLETRHSPAASPQVPNRSEVPNLSQILVGGDPQDDRLQSALRIALEGKSRFEKPNVASVAALSAEADCICATVYEFESQSPVGPNYVYVDGENMTYPAFDSHPWNVGTFKELFVRVRTLVHQGSMCVHDMPGEPPTEVVIFHKSRDVRKFEHLDAADHAGLYYACSLHRCRVDCRMSDKEIDDVLLVTCAAARALQPICVRHLVLTRQVQVVEPTTS
jgi:hypothetical protein